MMTREEFGRRFKAAREAAGLTQLEAAQALGQRQPRIAEYESGKRVPPIPHLVEIVLTLGLDPRLLVPEFFRDEDGPRAE
jgi:transcriptional regulator with XRE-family HTH domain